MWRRTVPFLFVFSVALNVAFLGFWGARSLHGETEPVFPEEPGCSVECQLHRDLGMNEAEWEALKPLLRDFARDRCRICCRLDEARAELLEAIALEDPDLETVVARQDEIQMLQRKMQDLIVRQLIQQKEVLTPDQQKKIFGFFRRTCRCAALEDEARAGCAGHESGIE